MDRPGKTASLYGMVAALAIAAVSCLPAVAAEYIHEDAMISGKEIHAFTDAGQSVSVVLGEFNLTVGGRVLSARDGVVWVDSHKVGSAVQHDITVYLEGDATIIEPGGVRTTDNAMVVTLHVQGRLGAAGTMLGRPLLNFPLYLRGKAARQSQRVVGGGRGAAAVARPTTPAAGAPAHYTLPADGAQAVKTPTATAPAADQTTKLPQRTYQPVTYRADRINSHKRDDGLRVTIAHGNVYLSQGDPDSDLFLELRSQTAVIFSGQRPPAGTAGQLGPQAKGSLAGLGGAGEKITGVYLEGDVIIARGERYMRSPRAYYDFTADRAIIIDPVFRTVQEQRNIPVYVRAKEARQLSAREIYFRDAKVSTSDFYSPSYHIGARTVYLTDNTPYDEEGVRLGERSWLARMTNTTFNVRGVPILYWPVIDGDFTEANTALRSAQVGKFGRFGFGVETQWHLFRLLGLVRPEGVKGRLELSSYDRAAAAGVDLEYARRVKNRQYSGYSLLFGLIDRRQKDEFGDERDNIPAPKQRGRVLMRHKEFLPQDWQLQFELSYICDRNFLEQYFPSEFFAGKEQETLLYAKKQRDNWAFTVLLQQRMNRFLTQTESAPDLSFYLLGESLLDDRLTLFSESHAGMKRFRPAKDSGAGDSRFFARLDTRNEIDLPMHFGPANIVPYAVGRATYWDDELPSNGEKCRPYGQVGVKANTHIWRVYDGVRSRLWDLNRLKHVITPEIVAWGTCSSGVVPNELFPISPDIEEHLDGTGGVSVGIHQRLQTKRGRQGRQETVDWMRLDVVGAGYSNSSSRQRSDGRLFFYRPEYSIARNHVDTDYTWYISDATTFLAYANYDVDDSRFDVANCGFAVARDPRLRYYAGARWIRELNTNVGTFGVTYKINRKYSISLLEQYDFEFDGGENLATSITLLRKLPRWFAGFTFFFDQSQDDVGLFVTFWPEGIPEVSIGGGRMSLLGKSDRN